MDTTQVKMLSMETMEMQRLPGTTQTRRICARSMEHKQKCAWLLAALANSGVIAGDAC